ncbi:MAG TPA: PIG-L deacetylase family protein [Bryobacteraceae bacterium]|jgi:LmbE family N-acetylglucosaminyl deacetylase|nr:PIG-L deacetylase family protein [Bryobacteraceae bacterium]
MISRRLFLGATASLPLAAQGGGSKMRVVIAGGHPGDPEYGCGGTAARLADLGHEVTLLYLNRGQKSCPAQPDDPGATTRTAEAEKACGILKARAVFAGQCDGHAIVDNAHYDDFARLIEQLAPDILFTQWPVDHHRDHRAVFNLSYDAWNRSQRRFALFLYEVSDGEDTFLFAPDRFVDITGVDERKRAACYAHASQTPDRYYALQTEVARFRGLQCYAKLAEAFVEHPGGPKVLLP